MIPLLGRLLRLGLVLFACASAARLSAQTTGSVRGVVTDAKQGTFVTGALVRVEGTSLETSTDRAGAYEFPAVPPGTYTIAVNYLGFDPGSTSVNVSAGQRAVADVALSSGVLMMEAFKVESIREGQSRAINQQRASNTISNIISSDAIGNLPDNTVADALTRLPGVNVVQEDADASYASIRGSEAKLNAVTLDGERLGASPDSSLLGTGHENRGVNLSLIPSELIGSVELVKALAADKDADSFGGSINMTTRSAFDLPRRSVSGRFDYYYNPFHNRDGYGGSINYLGALNEKRTLGLSAALNYRDVHQDMEDYEIVYYPKTDPAVSGIAGIKGDDAINEFDTRYRIQRRVNLGGNLNFDYKLGDRTVVKLRTLMNRSNKYESKFRTRYRALTNFDATSTDAVASGTSVRLTKIYEDDLRRQDQYRVGVSAETKLDSSKLNYGATYGLSTNKNSINRNDFDMAVSAGRRNYRWKLDRTEPEFPRISVTKISNGEDGTVSGTDETLTSIWKQTGNDAERDGTASLDYTLTQLIAQQPVDFKVGAKYRGKLRRVRPVLNLFAPLGAAGSGPTIASFTHFNQPTGDFFDGAVTTFGRYPVRADVFDYFDSHRSAFTDNTASGAQGRRYLAKIYDTSEDIDSGYGMATTKFGKLEAIAGVRYENTRTTYNWLAAPTGHVHGGNSYDNLFPSALFNYRFNKNVVLRFAWTNTIARPDYGELVPYQLTDDPAGGAEEIPAGRIPMFRGNPSLTAQKSRNYDVSLEWYYQPTGLLSVAAFHKDVSSFIYRSASLETVAGQQYLVYQYRNGASQTLRGIEFSWDQSLARLPSPFNGFGLSANATLLDATSTFYSFDPATNGQARRSQDFVPLQPKKIYNAQIYWEKYGITARVAVNYAGSFVRDVGGHVNDTIEYPATHIDASLSYRVTPNFTIYVQGKNLNDRPQRYYDGTPDKPEEYDTLHRAYVGGVKFNF